MNKRSYQSHYYEYDFWNPNLTELREFPANEIGLNRYLPLMPTKITISLDEGNTPLLKVSDPLTKYFSFKDLWIKHEEMNPTGSFKDRESAVVISAAKQRMISSVFLASSGNAALSTAAYCKMAGIRCTAFIPEKTDISKKELILLYGARIKTLPGLYEDVYHHVANIKSKSWNVTSGQNLLRTEGDKTIAYEIWEQLDGAPDVVIVPAGNGCCLAGIWKGFLDLKKIGKIKNIPKMIAVQIRDAAPLQKAMELGKDIAVVQNPQDSIAEGIVASESYCSPKAVRAIKQSKGVVITVSDEEILDTTKLIEKYFSFTSEPTSTAAFAALAHLKKFRSSKVVVINTGGAKKELHHIDRIQEEVKT